MAKASRELREYATSEGRTLTVDPVKGCIGPCRILGAKSANAPPNNNTYTREAREGIIPQVEGARVYVDHGPRGSSQERSYRDAMGVLRSVRESGDGLEAYFHFPPDHPLASQVCWDATNAPRNLVFQSTRGAARHGSQRGDASSRRLFSIPALPVLTLYQGQPHRSACSNLSKNRPCGKSNCVPCSNPSPRRSAANAAGFSVSRLKPG